MIVEMRTYHVRPGTAKETVDRLGNHFHHRVHLSPLGGMWHIVTGQMNTVVHMWPYESVQQRMDIRKEMVDPPNWPPPLREFLLEMDSVILLPAPFSPPMVPAKLGGLYEFCIDSYLPGGPAATMEAWSGTIEARTRLSPLVFCGLTEFGRLNQCVHVWAYQDLAHREAVHRELEASGTWPPAGGRELLRRQETLLTTPAWCSPLC